MILDAFRLDNKVAIVTGAGRGIGEGTATAFAEVGATVACIARTQSEIDSTVADIKRAGGQAMAIQCDVTDVEQVANMIDKVVAELGGIDIVVNNAGGGGHRPTAELTDDFLIEALKLNLMAPIHISRLATPQLRLREGAIVNISSGMSRIAEPDCLPYATAKAALEQATRNMAHELSPDIRVNALCLGAIQTPDFDKLVAAVPGIDKNLAAWTPVKRLGQPRDVALAALYLASSAGDFITGKVMDVDGGILLQLGAMSMMRGPG